MRHLPLVAAVLLLTALPLQGEDWPAWRGPSANGYSSDTGFPTTWSSSENIKWSVKLPGPGNSTPIVVGNRLFVSCAGRQGHRRTLICLDRKDGSTLWEQHVTFDADEATHISNPYCSSSPVSDGQCVIVWHGSAGLFAYDMDGTPLWQKDLGRFDHIWGSASSPIIHQDLVILNCGPGVRSFMLAVDKRTGTQQWRRELPGMASKEPGDYVGSWSSPLVVEDDGRDTLLISLPTMLHALDPNTGQSQWWCAGLGKLIYTSPIVSENTVVTMSGHHGPAMAVAMGGQGDVTATHRIWVHDEKTPQRIGSGVIVDDCVYILNEQGIAWCMELATGDILWRHRLGAATSWSSMCYADRHIYVNDSLGTTYVLKPDATECLVVAKNAIKQRMGASLAFSNGQVFLRTYDNLYCIEQSRAKKSPAAGAQ